MLDADQVLERDCLEKLIGILDQDAAIAWVGGRRLPLGTGWVSRGAAVIRELMAQLWARPRAWSIIGGISVIRTTLVRSIGLIGSHGVAGDTDLSWSLLERGHRLHIAQDVVVRHRDPTTLRGQFGQYFKQGRRSVHTFKRHPRMLLRWEAYARFFPLGLLLIGLRSPILGLAAAAAVFSVFHSVDYPPHLGALVRGGKLAGLAVRDKSASAHAGVSRAPSRSF